MQQKACVTQKSEVSGPVSLLPSPCCSHEKVLLNLNFHGQKTCPMAGTRKLPGPNKVQQITEWVGPHPADQPLTDMGIFFRKEGESRR